MNIKYEIPHFVRNDKFMCVEYGRVFAPMNIGAKTPLPLKPLAVIPNGAKRNEESQPYPYICNTTIVFSCPIILTDTYARFFQKHGIGGLNLYPTCFR